MTVAENQGGTQTLEVVEIVSSTAANPPVVTANGHGYSNNEWIAITDHDQEAINGVFQIGNVFPNTFDLTGEDTSGGSAGGATGYAGREIPLGNPITDAGVYQLVANLENMANGDSVLFKCYMAVRSGDDPLLAKSVIYSDAQGDGTPDIGGEGEVIVFSIPFTSPFEIIFTATQLTGDPISIEWSIWEH